MIDKLVLSTDKNNPNVFCVYPENFNKWRVQTLDGHSMGTAASLEQVTGILKNKLRDKYPYLLCLHSVDVLINVNTRTAL